MNVLHESKSNIYAIYLCSVREHIIVQIFTDTVKEFSNDIFLIGLVRFAEFERRELNLGGFYC